MPNFFFLWFSFLIFLTEFVTDILLVIFYFYQNKIEWAAITFGIIIVALIICQLYSLILTILKKSKVKTSLLVIHLFLGFPIIFRYNQILRRVDKCKNEKNQFDKMLKEINLIQLLNSFLQYLPQFLFQTYLIFFQNNKTIMSGVVAGLTLFSFLWNIFLQFYYCHNKDKTKNNENAIASTNTGTLCRTKQNSVNPQKMLEMTKINENLKEFGKYKMNEKNLVSKKFLNKNMDKCKIFENSIEMQNYNCMMDQSINEINSSTIFFEINEKSNENKILNQKKQTERNNISKESIFDDPDMVKRKGICSSQEMLNLIDTLQDLPAKDVDILAQSMIEIEDSFNQIDQNNTTADSKFLNLYPNAVNNDDIKLIESIDAALYENQILFQERIRKNHLTIQNLKLQDELLTKFIDLKKDSNNLEIMTVRDYENMCFPNVNRKDRLKHWKNYLQDINTYAHDNSTIQNTMTNSQTDIYINSTDSKISEDNFNINNHDSIDDSCIIKDDKKFRWSDTLILNEFSSDCGQAVPDDCNKVPYKNSLVETINAINVDSLVIDKNIQI